MTQFDRFTKRAKDVLRRSEDEARRFNQESISTSHLVLALIADSASIASRVLIAMGASLTDIRAAVEEAINREDDREPRVTGLTVHAKQVLELAIDESHRLGHHHVGTQHLLLGLLRQQDGVAAQTLLSHGITLELARAQVERVRSTSASEE